MHVIIAKTFIGEKPAPNYQVNHKDGDKDNNIPDNLEWVTPKENVWHSVNVLGNNIEDKNGNARGIYGIDANTGEIIYSFTCLIQAAKFFNEDKDNYSKSRHLQAQIWKALSGRLKTYRGCIWVYKDDYTVNENVIIENIKNSSYKANRGVRKLTVKDVEWIRNNYIPKDPEFGQRALSRKFNVDHSIIQKIINNKTYKDINKS